MQGCDLIEQQVLLNQCCLGLFLSNMDLECFHLRYFVKELRLASIAMNHHFFRQELLI